jgi:hypothetical protein
MAATATPPGTAAATSHRSCWRSTKRARRKRTIREAAPIGIVSPVTTKATPRSTTSGPANARTTGGVATDSWSAPSADDAIPNTQAAAATLAHQRQRGEGSEPVGVSSKTKPMHAAITKTLTSLAAEPTEGGAPRQASSIQIAYP